MSAIIKVLSNWPVFDAFILKYVESSIGHRTPSGMYTNEPSVKTAEFKVAKKWSVKGITDPKYFLTKSGCFWIASEIGQKIIPCLINSSLKVVATETESKTASTAIPFNLACSWRGIPNFLYVSKCGMCLYLAYACI